MSTLYVCGFIRIQFMVTNAKMLTMSLHINDESAQYTMRTNVLLIAEYR